MSRPKNHDRAIIKRVMKSRARQHKSIHKRHRNANLHAAGQSPQHAARGRPMQINAVINARITGRNNEGLPIHNKSDVAQKSLVKNAMNSFGIVMPAIGQAAHLRARCRSEFAHAPSLKAASPTHKSQSGSVPIGYFDFGAPRITRRPEYSPSASR